MLGGSCFFLRSATGCGVTYLQVRRRSRRRCNHGSLPRTCAVLTTPRDPEEEEVDVLVEASWSNGNVEFLHEQMLPQLFKIVDGSFLLDFALAVHRDEFLRGPLKVRVTRAFMESAISKAKFYRPPGPKTTHFKWPPARERKEIDYRAQAQHMS